MTTKFDGMSLQTIVRKETEGRTAAEERTFRFERHLKELERRLSDLENVVEAQLDRYTNISSIAPYKKTDD
jgi:ferritin-like metal-binding protein YciE